MNGNVTRNPDDYFSGGALMPAAEHKGFGLALIAELVGQALLGPASTKHWLLIAIKADQFREKTSFERVADEILDELRLCPPAPGSSGVQIPGERERIQRESSQNILQIPVSTWDQLPFMLINPAFDNIGFSIGLITSLFIISLFSQFSPIDLPFTVMAFGCGNKFLDIS